MRKIAVLLIVLLPVAFLHGQSPEKPVLENVIGPRLGVTWIIADPAAFNADMQAIFPNPGLSYFPVVSQFGINWEQRIKLGNTNHQLAIQEVLLLGGLEQNMFIPGLAVLIGFRADFGLEIGVGPIMNIAAPNFSYPLFMLAYPQIMFTIVAAVGYTISIDGISIPIDIAVVPIPSDGRPRITLLTGFNFSF